MTEKLTMPYVYTLAYPESMGGKVFYVGEGTGKRIDRHEQEARRGKSSNTYKIRVIRKIWDEGEEVVKRKLAFFETVEEALLYEIALIFFMPDLTNLTAGGDGVPIVRTEAHNRKIGQALTGRTLSEETCQKIRVARARQTFSEETRQKFRDAQRRLLSSEEEHRKRSEVRKASPRMQSHIRKLNASQKGRIPHNKGKTHSEETCKKMRDAPRLPFTEEHRRKLREAALQREAAKRDARRNIHHDI